METPWKKILACLTLSLTMIFVACGKSGNDPVAATPVPGIGVGQVGVGVDVRSCQVGQIFNQQYGCLNRGACQAGYGWIPSQGQCVQGTLVTEDMVYGSTYGARFFGSMQITNQQVFQNLMKYSGQCDPIWTGYNWGTWRCDYWTTRGGFLELRLFNNGGQMSANMFVGAGTSNPGSMANWSYTYQPSQNYIGFSQQAYVSPINNSTGMMIVGISYNGQDVGLRAIVETGSSSSSSLQIKLEYQLNQFATVNAQRY